ncbi:hypothetical protein R4P71_30330 [Rhodococcus sp. IEGM 1304]|uniref:DODA-type extradiol aromatic ring-opening family dioxygenase n=1 Tax=Rhodococcus sp. IEGM 1304 TaxID=3082227 RepID=UPI0029543A77|nr:hypothetical protein [Rhodococcus sp. IEGM 1304]MDV8128853.1 hypothetical protein [Rhodococcus sp. IEGM 1304]
MARVIGGIGISHTPSMGIEYDSAEGGALAFTPEWQPWFDGTRPVRDLVAELDPDHMVVIYNDHLNYFTLDNYPTLAIGVGNEFPQMDEGWGPRALPPLPGSHEWGIHLSRHLIENNFDMAVCHDLGIDHGIFSWLPYVLDRPFPIPVTPIAVNMIREPLPRPQRIAALGSALRQAIEAYPGDQRVLVIATGGMSHQISGARFGMANADLDSWFLDQLPDHLDELLKIEISEFMRLGGTEAAELALWYAMRTALSDNATVRYSFSTFPKITGCGVLAMTEPTEEKQ